MRFLVLDGWRGISALLVALYHLPNAGWFADSALISNGYLFVDYFFVLSGFVISHAYTAQLSGRDSLAQFVVRRFGRLWPLHAAVLGMLVLLEIAKAAAQLYGGAEFRQEPFTGRQSGWTVLTNLSLLHALGFYDDLIWNVPSWSISAEFWAYMLFAAVCLGARRQLVPVAATIAVAAAAVVALKSDDYMNATYDYGLYRCLYGFFTGCLVYRIYLAAEGFKRLVRSVPVAFELAALAVVVSFVMAAGIGPLTMLAPPLFGLTVLIFALEAGPVSRLIATRPVQWLGTWSYSIYMVHWLLLGVLDKALRVVEKVSGEALFAEQIIDGRMQRALVFGSDFDKATFAVAYLEVVVLVAAFTWRFIENPGRRYFNGLARRLPAGAVARPVSGE